jgi:hypothetical protein
MVTQANFDDLKQFELARHGDSLERFYWKSVSGVIPSYQTFWRTFIVLLTNRIDPQASRNWIRLRAGIPEPYERLLMANYSVFYDMVVSRAQIEAGKDALSREGFYHGEPFFFYAKACQENFDSLKSCAQKILIEAGVRKKIPGIPDNPLMAEITAYRNVVAHRPVLGRGIQHGRDMILKYDHLPRSGEPDFTWSGSEAIPGKPMTDLIALQTRLWTELAACLEKAWAALATGFEQFRVTDTFIRAANVNPFLPIRMTIEETAVPSMINPVPASGQLNLSGE